MKSIKRLFYTGLCFLTTTAAIGGTEKLHAQETTLYNFEYAIGRRSTSSPVISGPVYDASAGAFFGATSKGGPHRKGVIYKLTPPASAGGKWRYSVIFDNALKRTTVAAADGVVYVSAGDNDATESCATKPGVSCGAIFLLTPPTSGAGLWIQNIVYKFTPGADGIEPSGRLAIDRHGAIYGTAGNGGTGCVRFRGCGTVFKLTPPSALDQKWSYSVVFHFPGSAYGQHPTTGVILDKIGNIYGTAEYNDSVYSGLASRFLVFKLTPPAATGDWTEMVLYRFPGPAGGESVTYETPLAMDADGALYGSFSPCASGYCTSGDEEYDSFEEYVFQLVPSQADPGVWNFAIVRKFPYDRGSPAAPYELTAPLTVDAQGTVYGATLAGGPEQGGTVFALRPRPGAPGEWDYKSLINFKGSSLDLVAPNGGLAEGPNGLLYGATQRGGSGNEGSFFSVRR